MKGERWRGRQRAVGSQLSGSCIVSAAGHGHQQENKGESAQEAGRRRGRQALCEGADVRLKATVP